MKVTIIGGAQGVRHHLAAVTRTVVEAMQDEGVRRLVVQSSLGASDSGSHMPLPLRVVMKARVALLPSARPSRTMATTVTMTATTGLNRHGLAVSSRVHADDATPGT